MFSGQTLCTSHLHDLIPSPANSLWPFLLWLRLRPLICCCLTSSHHPLVIPSSMAFWIMFRISSASGSDLSSPDLCPEFSGFYSISYFSPLFSPRSSYLRLSGSTVQPSFGSTVQPLTFWFNCPTSLFWFDRPTTLWFDPPASVLQSLSFRTSDSGLRLSFHLPSLSAVMPTG
jgi:hypothetical protein